MNKEELKTEVGLIKAKLDGLLDDKQKFRETFGMEVDKTINNTIAKITTQYFEKDTINWTKDIADKLSEAIKIKGRCNTKRFNEFGGYYNFYKWYKGQPQKCCYCGISQKQLSSDKWKTDVMNKSDRKRILCLFLCRNSLVLFHILYLSNFLYYFSFMLLL